MDSSRSNKKRKRRKSSRSRRQSRSSSSESSGLSVASELRSRLRPTGRARRLKWYEKALIYALVAICLVTIIMTVLIWKSRAADPLEWADLTQLPEIVTPPPAVSSEADPESPAYIEPYLCRGHAKYAIEKIHQILRQDRGYRYVRLEENQVSAVAVTPLFGFHDDLVFQARNDPERVEIYSASRVGIEDFGANRKRLEEMREILRSIRVVK